MTKQHLAYWSLMAVLVVGATSIGAPARAGQADDELASMTADCTAPDLPRQALDICLERARTLAETDPSPRLQALEARLELEAEQTQGSTDIVTRTAGAVGRPDMFADTATAPNSGLDADGALAKSNGPQGIDIMTWAADALGMPGTFAPPSDAPIATPDKSNAPADAGQSEDEKAPSADKKEFAETDNSDPDEDIAAPQSDSADSDDAPQIDNEDETGSPPSA